MTIDSLSVADSFGIVTPIPHYASADGAAGAWRMFALREPGGVSAAGANRLVLPPGVVGPLDSEPIEDVLLLRDELAEIVWGVERIALDAAGAPVDRRQAWSRAQPPAALPIADATPHYRLGSTTPDYWVPFIPVDVNDGPLRLRRGRLPTGPAQPMGKLIGYPDLTLFLEEVPKKGERVINSRSLAKLESRGLVERYYPQICRPGKGCLWCLTDGQELAQGGLDSRSLNAIRAALERAGVIFTIGSEPGVKLRTPEQSE